VAAWTSSRPCGSDAAFDQVPADCCADAAEALRAAIKIIAVGMPNAVPDMSASRFLDVIAQIRC
jgi:hypothetical protein